MPDPAAPVPDPIPDVFSLVSHPWREDPPARRWTLVAVIAVASVLAGMALDSVGIGVASLGVLFAGLSRYFLPTIFEIDPRGVHTRHLGVSRSHPWSRFRRVALRPEGVFLGTFPQPRRLDVWRGVYIRTPGNREQVYAFARARIAAQTTR